MTKAVADARETGGQFVGQGVDEVVLPRIAREIGEGQHDDRKPRGLGGRLRGDACGPVRIEEPPRAARDHNEQRRERGGERREPETPFLRRGRRGRHGRQDLRAGDVGDPQRVGPHGPGDVLERLVAEVDELGLDPAAHMIVGGAGDAYAARLADALEPRRDIDAVAQNILAVDQHVAEIDADAVEDASGLGNARVAFGHLLLHANRAFDRRDDGRKFQQHAVAHRLDEPPAECANDRRRRLAMVPHRARRPRFVLAHQPRVADDVGGEDRGEAAGLRSLLRHPGLAQAVVRPFVHLDAAWIAALLAAGLSTPSMPRSS